MKFSRTDDLLGEDVQQSFERVRGLLASGRSGANKRRREKR